MEGDIFPVLPIAGLDLIENEKQAIALAKSLTS